MYPQKGCFPYKVWRLIYMLQLCKLQLMVYACAHKGATLPADLGKIVSDWCRQPHGASSRRSVRTQVGCSPCIGKDLGCTR